MNVYDANSSLQALAEGGLRQPGNDFWPAFQGAWPLLERFTKYRVKSAQIPQNLSKDCVQEFFRRVCRYRMSYRGRSEGELWAWLGRVFDNARRDMVRRELGRPVRQVPFDSSILENSHSQERFDPFGGGDNFAALEICLKRLGQEDRIVIQLRYFEPRMSQRAAAATLGCSAGWVCKIEKKVLRELLECMRAKGIDYATGNPLSRADAADAV